MKFFMALFLGVAATAFAAGTPPREIEMKTEKIGEVVHWMPENIEVTQGETVKITAKHDLEGGFDFHGLFIPELKISEKVDRHKPTVVTKKIPAKLKAGSYKVQCQFHPKHAPANLVVKAAEKKSDEPEKKTR